MQDTQRTLEDVEIEEIVSNLLQIAQKDFGAVLR
jgi:phenylalanyl-tRNA synthetase beta subunit